MNGCWSFGCKWSFKMKEQGQWDGVTSEVYAEIRGTVSPHTQVSWFPIQGCGYYVSVSQNLAFRLPTWESWKEMQILGSPQTYRISRGWGGGSLNIFWAPQVTLRHTTVWELQPCAKDEMQTSVLGSEHSKGRCLLVLSEQSWKNRRGSCLTGFTGTPRREKLLRLLLIFP